MPTSSKRLLIVDDEPELMASLREMLGRRGYEVTGFTSGEEALEALREQPFDVLLSDLMMPGMDGIELLRAALEIDPHLVGIIMTGQGTIQSAVEAMKVGAFDYLLKPFKLQAALPVITRALELRHLQVENLQLREKVAIHELSQALASTLDYNAIVQKVADVAQQQCAADELSLLLPTPDGHGLSIAVARGKNRKELQGQQIPITEGIAGWVARHQQPLLLNGNVNDSRFAPRFPRPEVASAMVVPLVSGGRLTGVLNVNATTDAASFTCAQVEALALLAGLAAPALENARFYQQVRESEKQLRIVTESARVGLVMVDRERRYTYANETYAKILDLPSPDVIGKFVGDVLNPIYEEKIRPNLDRAFAGERISYELQRATSKGVRHYAVKYEPTQSDGEVTRVVVVVTDITKNKKNELALRDSEERFRQMAESISEVFWLLDTASGEILYVSPAYERIWGRTCQSLYQHPASFSDAVHAEDREWLLERSQDKTQRQGLDIEYRIVRPDGSIRWIWDRGFPILDENGDVYRIAGIAQDITERNRAKEALQLAHRDLELRVQERTAELALANQELRSKETYLLKANQIFAELSRLRATSEAELQSALHHITEAGCELLHVQRCSVWLFGDDRSHLRCLDLCECNGAQNTHSDGLQLQAVSYPDYFRYLESEHVIAASDAANHPGTHEFAEFYLAATNVVSMLDTAVIIGGQMAGVFCCEHQNEMREWESTDKMFAGSLAALCALVLESYERSRAERSLMCAKEEAVTAQQNAELANHAKSEFLSRMSHELRTPLNAILGFGQILEMSHRLNEKDSTAISHILKSGRHLLGLINEVLDIARIESGRISLSPEPIAVALTLREVLDIVRPLASAREIQLVNETSIEAERYVQADQQRLRQILLNLLSNAIKYNRDAGQVNLCWMEKDEFLHLEVRDTGPGLTPEEIEKLFTPFERLKAAQSQIEGTGIGLVLCKRLIEAMSGRIGVSSTPGQGSTFWFELPLVESQTAHLERSLGTARDVLSLKPSEPPSELQTVLYIEDNLSNLKLIESILEERTEIRLLSAMQGGIGLELAREHTPDLILLDLHLPDISGDVVLRRLQADPKTRSIPVVVLSADAMPAQISKLNSAGARGYLTKPLDVAEFLRVLEKNLKEGAS